MNDSQASVHCVVLLDLVIAWTDTLWMHVIQVEYEEILPFQDFALRVPPHAMYRLPWLLEKVLQEPGRVRILHYLEIVVDRNHASRCCHCNNYHGMLIYFLSQIVNKLSPIYGFQLNASFSIGMTYVSVKVRRCLPFSRYLHVLFTSPNLLPWYFLTDVSCQKVSQLSRNEILGFLSQASIYAAAASVCLHHKWTLLKPVSESMTQSGCCCCHEASFFYS